MIERMHEADRAEIMRNFERFWSGDRDLDFLRSVHHPMFFIEFGDTAFAARADDTASPAGGEILGYLLGFVAPGGYGYIHFVAVRDEVNVAVAAGSDEAEQVAKDLAAGRRRGIIGARRERRVTELYEEHRVVHRPQEVQVTVARPEPLEVPHDLGPVRFVHALDHSASSSPSVPSLTAGVRPRPS